LESEGSECHFRNIRIKELPSSNPPASEVAEEDQGFVSLYTGVDLSGWKQDAGHQGHWQPKDWILDYDGRSDAADKCLWSERSFRDFELIVDWKVSASAGGKDVSQESSIGIRLRRTVRVPFGPAEAAKARGQWNRLHIVMRGDQLSAQLNDKKIIDRTLTGVPAEGFIGLQHDGAPIQFANIYVKELK
jgi:hypothetical protein